MRRERLTRGALADLPHLHDSSNGIVYLQRSVRGRPVVLKVAREDHAGSNYARRLANEYQLTVNLDVPGVRRARGELLVDDRPGLVLDWVDGVPLDRAPRERFARLEEQLEIGIGLASVLERLHRERIVHRNVCPAHVLLSGTSLEVTLIDFGAAARIEPRPLRAEPADTEDVALGCVAPEQTGRVNRRVDHRADLYALGALLYELLTGRPLFQAKSAAELIHAHLAERPAPPSEVCPGLPTVLCELVLRLVAKDPDERYQSAYGVRTDLERCLEQLRARGAVEPFPLGRSDYRRVLRLPQTLPGREEELRALEEIVLAASRGTGCVVLLSGPAGVGKTALAEELERRAAKLGGAFVKGRFEPTGRHAPEAALVDALAAAIDGVLTTPAAQLAEWRLRILEATGDDVGLLFALLPRLELVVGARPPPELDPAEHQRRLRQLLPRALLALAPRDRPLVALFDNLERADQTAVELLAALVPALEEHALVLVGAYRSDALTAGHPLEQLFEVVRTTGAAVRELALEGLSLDGTARLTAEALESTPEVVLPLARLVRAKTGGNPLFAGQLLQSLHDEGLLAFDEAERRWRWDEAAIAARELTASVAALVGRRISRLPEETRSLLALAACIGVRFDTERLAEVAGLDRATCAARLQPAVENELVQPIAPRARTASAAGPRTSGAAEHFELAHDRVRVAAEALLSEEARRRAHAVIGRRLLRDTPAAEREAHLFEIVDHLNEGALYVTEPAERRELASLDLAAGQRAARAGAFEDATRYFGVGIGMLPEDAWTRAPTLTLELHVGAVEAEYLCARADRAALLAAQLLDHVKDPLVRVRVHQLRVRHLTAENRDAEAIDVGAQALAELGVHLPGSAEGLAAAAARASAELEPLDARIEALEHLPALTDPRQLAVLDVLMRLTAPAERASPALFQLLVAMGVAICAKHGGSPIASLAYVGRAAATSAADRFDVGERWGQLALRLAKRSPSRAVESVVRRVFETRVRPWKQHVRECIPGLQAAYRAALLAGEIETAHAAALAETIFLFQSGAPLAQIRRQQAEHLAALSRSDAGLYLRRARTWADMVGALAEPRGEGGAPEPGAPAAAAPEPEGSNDLLDFDRLEAELVLRYLFGDYASAAAAGRRAEAHRPSLVGEVAWARHTVVYALALLAHATSGDAALRAEALETVRGLVERMRPWVASVPANFAHQFALVEAEEARVTGDVGRALVRFGDALRLAREGRFLHYEALVYEREAAFHRALGREDLAGTCLRRAVDAYRTWGALRKVQDLEARDQALARPALAAIDTSAVVKASQLLSEDLRLEQVLERLMGVVLEVAGAERGVLLQKTARGLVVRARGRSGARAVETSPGTPAEEDGAIALSVVNWVARTHQIALLSDACRDPTFGADPHVSAERVRSLASIPLLYRGRLSGVLYLENNLAADVFTADRLDVLRALAAQAAVSMENAALHADLERKIESLSQSERKVRTILDNTLQLVGTLTPSGMIAQVNRTALQFVGVSEESVLGRPFWDSPWWSHSSEKRAQLRAGIEEAARGKVVRFETTHETSGGQLRDIDFSLKPMADADGRVFLIIAEGRDITERKEAEAAIRALNQELDQRVRDRTAQLEAVNRELESFAYSVSHDLRAPLRSIKGFSRMLEEEHASQLDEAARAKLERIRAATERMGGLIDDVLKLSRVARGELRRAPVSLTGLARSIVDELQRLEPERRVEIHIEEGLEVTADPGLLRLALENLLGNAWKFTSKVPLAQITLGRTVRGGAPAFYVKDNGAGFAPADAGRLFAAFRRLHSAAEFPGNGIGLATVQRILRRHGGRIEAEGAVDQGATFYFTLPEAR